MALKLGMQSGPQNCTYEELRRLWRLADSSGFYSVATWDHFYETPIKDGRGSCFEGVSIMAALAAETSNVRVGALVFGMCNRHPTVLAKAAVTVDHVSNGRLDLGIGAGGFDLEHDSFGLPLLPIRDRQAVLEEGVQIIKSMLTQESTTFIGKHFQVQDAYCFPRPIQARIPIVMGGGGERRGLRLVARYADAWSGGYITPEGFKRKLEVLDHWCEVEKRDPREVTRTVNLRFYMGTDEADAQRMRQQFHEEWGTPVEEPGAVIVGTAAQTIEFIRAYADAGAQQVNIALRAPFNWNALQAYIEEVMPAFA